MMGHISRWGGSHHAQHGENERAIQQVCQRSRVNRALPSNHSSALMINARDAPTADLGLAIPAKIMQRL